MTGSPKAVKDSLARGAISFDHRLTRSVSYWRFRSTLGEMMTASDAAAVALHSLLGEKGRAELNAYRAVRHPSPE